jgi:predicted RNase H-like HicB family nuclease
MSLSPELPAHISLETETRDAMKCPKEDSADTICLPFINDQSLHFRSPSFYSKAMRQVLIYPDPDDGGFVAEVPSLPGCISQGQTRQEAVRNIREAIVAWLGAARDTGQAVPEDKFEALVYIIDENLEPFHA